MSPITLKVMPIFTVKIQHSQIRRPGEALYNSEAGQAGRSAKREERPKDGPEGVSGANHPVSLTMFKSLGPGLRRDDEHLGISVSRAKFSPDSDD
ncbi:hypothetical protein ACFONN_21365 [Dyella humi]|uniref:Uncharacterized protein n=1 Tax=Dyella humi TaxID=1770547 RepID=A0ABW8IFG9_9GAMM